jgi:two-component system CheB/CheR fusion protein
VQLARGVVTELPAELTTTPVFIPAASTGVIKVLHIEDDPGISRSMEMLLRLEGYEVTKAASRDEALQQIEVHGLRPDLILCDFQLPMGFTGDEIVADIATRLQFKPPTIMLTGDIADAHVRKAKLIADRILPKPVDINLLLREIEILLAKRQ